MARIKSTQKLIIESFPEQREWIGPMFVVLNKFISDVITAINGALVFGQNVQGQEFEYDFVYRSPTVTFPQVFKWNIMLRPRALIVVSSEVNIPSINNNFSPIMINVSWGFNSSNEVFISDAVQLTGNPATISDLGNGLRYKIRVRVSP